MANVADVGEQTKSTSSPKDEIHPSNLDQTAQLPSTESAFCQCLSTIGTLLAELEARSLAAENGSLDSMLAVQKDFLGRCNSVLNCLDCSMRAEYILLLGLLAQNLTNQCDNTVSKYLEEVRPSVEHSSSRLDPPIPSPPSETNFRVNLGQYEVESTQEWHTLIKVLIVMQLQVTSNTTLSYTSRLLH